MDFKDISKSLRTSHSPIQDVEKIRTPKLQKRGVGRPKKPNIRPKLLRLNKLLIKQLDYRSELEGLSPSQVVTIALKEYLNR